MNPCLFKCMTCIALVHSYVCLMCVCVGGGGGGDGWGGGVQVGVTLGHLAL